jgi:hypothetical protein
MKFICNGFLAFVLLVSYSLQSQAEEYLLSFNRNCSTEGAELSFECKKSDDLKHYIYQESGIWKARTLKNQVQANFKVLREDENILVLEQETLYSGNQVVYIMKKNNHFYLVQVAYSDILNNNESTTKQGIYIKTKD